jgi:hypothetical protein
MAYVPVPCRALARVDRSLVLLKLEERASQKIKSHYFTQSRKSIGLHKEYNRLTHHASCFSFNRTKRTSIRWRKEKSTSISCWGAEREVRFSSMGQRACRMLRPVSTPFSDKCYLLKDYSYGSHERREEYVII